MKFTAIRKALALALASAMILSLSACGERDVDDDSSSASTTTSSASSTASGDTTTSAASTAAGDTTSAPSGTNDEAPVITVKVQDPKEVNYGAVKIAWAAKSEIKANSDILNLKIKVKDGAAEGNHAIKIYSCDLCNDAMANVTAKFNDGVVAVSADGKTNVPTDAAPSEFTFVVSNVGAKAGDEITVPIKAVNNPGISAMDMVIGYDKDALEITEVTSGSDFSAIIFVPNLNPNVKFVTE